MSPSWSACATGRDIPVRVSRSARQMLQEGCRPALGLPRSNPFCRAAGSRGLACRRLDADRQPPVRQARAAGSPGMARRAAAVPACGLALRAGFTGGIRRSQPVVFFVVRVREDLQQWPVRLDPFCGPVEGLLVLGLDLVPPRNQLVQGLALGPGVLRPCMAVCW